MIPQSMIKQLRKTTNRWLTETAVIERESNTRGSYGQQIHDWETVASDVACRVITAGTSSSASNQTLSNQEIMIDKYKIVLQAETEVNVDYRITVGGHQYRVIAVMDDRTDELDVHVLAYKER